LLLKKQKSNSSNAKSNATVDEFSENGSSGRFAIGIIRDRRLFSPSVRTFIVLHGSREAIRLSR